MIIKKIIFILIMNIFFFLFTNATGDNTIEEPASSPSVGFVFCNDENNLTNRLDMITTPGQKNEICLLFYNETKENITIKTQFVEGTMNKKGLESCGEEGDFTKRIDQSRDNIFEIQAENRLVKKVDLTFPAYINGKTHGCLVFSTQEGTSDEIKENKSTFSFIFRKGFIIRAFVGDMDTSASNNTIIKNTYIEKDKKEKDNIIIYFETENKGIMDSMISITGTITNIFGFKKTFLLENIPLNVGASVKSSSLISNQEIKLPEYKGLYNITLEMDRSPYLGNMDFDKVKLDPKFTKGGTVIIKKIYFEMPRMYLGGLILIIILLILAFRKPKQKIVYVQQQQQPQQPTPNV